jgi:hypothetical protein
VCGPGLLSRYSDKLQAGQSGDRIPVGARFFTPIQTDPAANPASYTVGTGSCPGVKWPEHGIDHPPPSSAGVKERVELYLYSPSRAFMMACYGANFTFYLFILVCSKLKVHSCSYQWSTQVQRKFVEYTKKPTSRLSNFAWHRNVSPQQCCDSHRKKTDARLANQQCRQVVTLCSPNDNLCYW